MNVLFASFVLAQSLSSAAARDHRNVDVSQDIRLESINQVEVWDLLSSSRVQVGLALHFFSTPRGPRVAVVLVESSGAIVQLDCPDSHCSVLLGTRPSEVPLPACYEERFGTFQGLKLDSPKAVVSALNSGTALRVSVPVLEGTSTRMVQFQFAAHRVPPSFGAPEDTCEGDFWAAAEQPKR